MYLQINNYLLEDPQDMNDILIVYDDQNDQNSDLSVYVTLGLAEYLSANRIYTKVIKFRHLKFKHIKLFRGFIFYQTKYTNFLKKFTELAKYFNKTLFIINDQINPIPQQFMNQNYILINIDKDNIVIPDIILKQTLEKISLETPEIDYLFILNLQKDIDWIVAQIEYNKQILDIKGYNISIISHSSNKFKFPEKFLKYVKFYFYNYFSEKFYLLKNSKKVILNNENKLYCFINYIECKLCGISCIQVDNHSLIPFNDSISAKNQTSNKEIIEKYSAIYSTSNLYSEIKSKLKENVVFNVPSTATSGGMNVIIKHANILRKNGKDVTLLSDGDDENNVITSGDELNVVSIKKRTIKQNIDKLVATLWTTCFNVEAYPDAERKIYLVQGFETDFSDFNDPYRLLANITYRYKFEYTTVSKWCQNWLENKFNHTVKYCPNGIDTKRFFYVDRNFNTKIRILIEGSNKQPFRRIDESFEITNGLNHEEFEILYLTYNGEPKAWYKYENFLQRVPYEEVHKIYQSCHILLKSSIFESFSYPPLEMMATGGLVVLVLNEGNKEYAKHEENCMVYTSGNIEEARKHIHRIIKDEKLRKKLIKGGLETARSRDWSNIIDKVLYIYQ